MVVLGGDRRSCQLIKPEWHRAKRATCLEGIAKVSPGGPPCGALIQDRGQREDVDLLVAVCARKLLRRHVLGRAMHVCGRQKCLCRVLLRRAPCESRAPVSARHTLHKLRRDAAGAAGMPACMLFLLATSIRSQLALILLMPKSAILARPLTSSRMFCGLRSLCTTLGCR